MIVSTQQIRDVGHCEGDPNKIAPTKDDGNPNRAYDSSGSIHVSILGFLRLVKASIKRNEDGSAPYLQQLVLEANGKNQKVMLHEEQNFILQVCLGGLANIAWGNEVL